MSNAVRWSSGSRILNDQVYKGRSVVSPNLREHRRFDRISTEMLAWWSEPDMGVAGLSECAPCFSPGDVLGNPWISFSRDLNC